jgi:hypothetical protein
MLVNFINSSATQRVDQSTLIELSLRGTVGNNCDKNIAAIIVLTGRYLVAFWSNSTSFIFNNIITNKNKIAIAPTYTIINKIGKNSIPNKSNNKAAFINASTNQNTLEIGL